MARRFSARENVLKECLPVAGSLGKIAPYLKLKGFLLCGFMNYPCAPPQKQRLKKIRGFLRKVCSACQKEREYPDRVQSDWRNFAHIHLDWHGYGDYL